MSEALSSVGSFLSSNLGNISKALSVAGTGANVYSGIENARNLSNYNSTQNYIQSLVQNPTKMAAAAAKFQQPLSAGLTDAVTNQVQGQLAERGQGGSPAALQSVLAQALAPYIQQNQNTAIQTLLQSLGVGTTARPGNLPTMDLSKLMAQLKLNSSGSSDPYQTILNAQEGSGDQTLQTQIPDFTDSVAA